MPKTNVLSKPAKSAPNITLIKQALHARQANNRQGTTHTKSRGEVSGGGRKPWRQKGTGRARAGSNRSPIWVGGGITFGPRKERNFKHALPKKMSKRALGEMLNYLHGEKKIIIVDFLSLKEAKTKLALKLLGEHGLTGKKVVFVTGKIEPELVLATRNITGTAAVLAQDLSITDLVAGWVVLDKAAAQMLGLAGSADKKSVSAKVVAKKVTKKEMK